MQFSDLKQIVKKLLKKNPRDFDSSSLPWIDKPGKNIDAFLKHHKPLYKVSYDLKAKLEFWDKNGFVILENAISQELIDAYLSDLGELIENNVKYPTEIRVDLPEYSARPLQKISELPKEVLVGKYIKINDFHNQSVYGKKLMLHSAITTFLNAVFDQKPVGMQSLTFLFGSQQDTHQDFPYVTSQVPSHLAAAWIPLEDVKPDSGPLYYYPGSHKVKKFDFGNGIYLNGESSKNPTDFGIYLDKACRKMGLKKETLLAKKGDVLIWHAALVHGGEDITNPEQTRKSFVCHYSTEKGYQWHRKAIGVEPKAFEYNGGAVYDNPNLPEVENSFEKGLSYSE